MPCVTVSSKYQLSIPPDVREKLEIKPGQQFEILVYDGCMHLVPVVAAASLRGLLKGSEVEFLREKQDRRL